MVKIFVFSDDGGCKMQDTGYRMLDTTYWILDECSLFCLPRVLCKPIVHLVVK